ncbi:MAG TPA: outer membrane beta-barrel protein [Pseudolabrys sp.]
MQRLFSRGAITAAALVLGVNALTLAAPSAFAADISAKQFVKAPVLAATNWTGLYVNGGVGYGMWAADTTTVDPRLGLCDLCTTQVQGGKGWLGVVGIGFDYQLSPKIVAGVFLDGNLSSLKGTIQDGGPFYAGDIKQTSAWAVGARAGWLVDPRILAYVNTGYTSARFSGANMVTTFNGKDSGATTATFTANGWFVGGGVETAIAPGWFWRNEYRFAYYGNHSIADVDLLNGPQNNITFKPTVQTFTTQFVYKFDSGHVAPAYPATSPVMAANWTGFYLNGGAGYGSWAADTYTADPVTGQCAVCATQVQGGKGYLGTIGAGYDWQFASAWVAGVFGEYTISSLKGTIQDQDPVWSGEIKQTSAWAAGARVGWLATPAILTYVNGGYSSARFSGTAMERDFPSVSTGNTTPGFTSNGWFMGGGTETTAAFLGKGWFWRNEYRYASYRDHALTDTGRSGVNSNIIFKPTVQTVTSQLVFKFN